MKVLEIPEIDSFFGLPIGSFNFQFRESFIVPDYESLQFIETKAKSVHSYLSGYYNVCLTSIRPYGREFVEITYTVKQ